MKVRALLVHPIVDLLIRLAAVVSLGLSAFAAAQAYGLAHCQAAYNEATNSRTRVLADSAEQERRAERTADDSFTAFMKAYIAGAPAPERAQLFAALAGALDAQQRERLEADIDRAAHPVPPPPSETCS